ncbi:MAG: DM13 domain-containing protein [Gemmatimonadaceae bacterium]|nr:DM13 domain-containing protein [Gemmatimonadaceae bacterium]
MSFLAGRSLVASLLLVGACNSTTPPTAPDAVLVDASAAPTGTGVSGRFVGVGHEGRGTVKFTVQGGTGSLEFSSDFVVSGVPGPFVYVNTTNNANTGRPLRVSALKSTRGVQSYTFQVAAGVRYGWVLVWCDPYNVPVAEAEIPPTP